MRRDTFEVLVQIGEQAQLCGGVVPVDRKQFTELLGRLREFSGLLVMPEHAGNEAHEPG